MAAPGHVSALGTPVSGHLTPAGGGVGVGKQRRRNAPKRGTCEGPECSVTFTFKPTAPHQRFCGNRCRQAAYRLKKRLERQAPAIRPVRISSDPVGDLVRWSREKLVIPPGHPNAKQPMELPAFGVDFLRDAIRCRESLLCVARKNAKSALIAVYVLGRLAGPIRLDGWRGGVFSVSAEKSNELKKQCEEIAEASGLEGLEFRRTPAPGHVLGPSGRLDILSADKHAGHAAGFDDVLFDELGLLPERSRELVQGALTSISARDGRFIGISIRGDGPFCGEMIQRRHEVGVSVHLYESPAGCRLDDQAAWEASNPGLRCGIKSRAYMEHMSRRAIISPADESGFRSLDLNQPGSPNRQMVVGPVDWAACHSDPLPARDGACVLAVDLGASASMTAAAALWPGSRRLEVWGAVPGIPALKDRQRKYQQRFDLMVKSGHLAVHAGRRVTDVSRFLLSVAGSLKGQRITRIGADRYRKAEMLEALEAAGLNWGGKMHWRGTGSGAKADGSHDVRAFQRSVLERELYHDGNLLLSSGVACSELRFDVAGNPALHKSGGPNDSIQAAVIACGLGQAKVRRQSWRYAGRVA